MLETGKLSRCSEAKMINTYAIWCTHVENHLLVTKELVNECLCWEVKDQWCATVGFDLPVMVDYNCVKGKYRHFPPYRPLIRDFLRADTRKRIYRFRFPIFIFRSYNPQSLVNRNRQRGAVDLSLPNNVSAARYSSLLRHVDNICRDSARTIGGGDAYL